MELCQDTHIAPPEGLGACVATINAPEGRSPGAAADLLTKLVRMLSEVQVVASKRSVIIASIAELEEAREEDGWLHVFETDEARYKVGSWRSRGSIEEDTDGCLWSSG